MSAEQRRDRQGASPKLRRAFGCITWINMAILVFLAAAFLLPLPFKYLGDTAIFNEVPSRLSFFGLLLIVPGMILGAFLGYRTYRGERRRSMFVGTAIGAIIGWTSFFTPAWIRSPLWYVFVPLVLVATGLVLYALFSRDAAQRLRLWLVVAGALIVVLCGLAALVNDFDALGLAGALFAAAASAVGGTVAGIGYARAGGKEMLPPTSS